MADDEMVEEEPEESVEPLAPARKNASGAGAPHVLLRLFLGSAGLLLIIGFFLPWLNLADGETVSGMELVVANDRVILALVGDTQRWLLLLIPGFGVALTGVAVSGVRHSGPIAAMLGILIVGYGVVTVIFLFFQKTALGLWLILLGAFLAVATGVVAFIRSRERKGAADEDGEKPDDD